MFEQFNGKWFVLYTRNKKESAVVDSLGYNSITPLQEKAKLRNKVRTVELVPKYENYVFIQHDGSEAFFDRCVENANVVSFAGGSYNKKQGVYPQAMTDEEVQNIVENELKKNLHVNMEVIITDGPYTNQSCIVQSYSGDDAEVEIHITDSCKIVETIPSRFLKKA